NSIPATPNNTTSTATSKNTTSTATSNSTTSAATSNNTTSTTTKQESNHTFTISNDNVDERVTLSNDEPIWHFKISKSEQDAYDRDIHRLRSIVKPKVIALIYTRIEKDNRILMANSEYDYDSPQVYRLGKTYLANNQGQFYIQNDPIIHMAAGDRHTIIVTETGRAFAFGDNSSGQLGLGHTNNVERVSCIKSLKFGETGEKVILAACGRESSLVATNRGAIYGFGSNSRSQLGISSPDSSTIHPQPVKLEYFKGKIVWKQISMGAEHACALTDEGVVYIWGANDDGQCAQPRKHDVIAAPRELRIETEVTAISCGYHHTALIDVNGRLFLFGNNEDRQLGRSVSDKFAGPIEVSMPNKVKAVACGNQHTVVLTEKGDVYTCGYGDRGQLGLGPRVLSAETFENVQGLPKCLTTIAAGEGHTAVLTVRGDLYVFGDGKHGKLGSQTHSNEFAPCLVDKFKTYNVLKVVCGSCQTIVFAQKKTGKQKLSPESEEDGAILDKTLPTIMHSMSPAQSLKNTSPFYNACRNNNIGLVKKYLQKMSLDEINKIEPNGSTALHVAAYRGYEEIVELLLQKGACYTTVNRYNSTPLNEAKTDKIKQMIRRRMNKTTRFISESIEWVLQTDKADFQAHQYWKKLEAYGRDPQFYELIDYIKRNYVEKDLQNIEDIDTVIN
ncbi:unnamed protein product, partial [Rotaria sordida]